MTADELKKIVQKFADRPVDVVLGKDTICAEVHGQLLEVGLTIKGGAIFCVEGGIEELAEQWIVRRLGNLEILANRILEFVPEDKELVPVEAELVGVVDLEDTNTKTRVNDVVHSLSEMVDQLPVASTNVIYLTSDAGEGKTCVLDALARLQARAFLDRKSEWLLLPIGLAGRPFMRLDEVIVAALANRYRFRYLYYEALLELVKRRSIVLGLDGFEEMFIESQTGEVASSLGNLVARLDSQGTLIFAARKAYYRFSNMEAQAKLFKSIRDMNVAFGEAQLIRWSRNQFIMCCENYGLTFAESDNVYDAFCRRLPSNHPILTRAVLARRAIKEVVDAGGNSALANVLGSGDTSAESVFERFVNALILREANEKWIDRTGEAAEPILSPEEHYSLLMAIAEEMWLSGTEFLSWDILETATEIAVDSFDKGPSAVRQSKERIRQHALLQEDASKSAYSFDHEEFRSFFLGCKLGQLLVENQLANIRRILGVRMLPDLAVRVTVQKIQGSEVIISSVVKILHDVAGSGPKSSFSRINAANLLVRLVSERKLLGQQLKDMYYSADTISAVDISGISFEDCLFERISVLCNALRDVNFRSCTIVDLVYLEGLDQSSGYFDVQSIPDSIHTGLDDSAPVHYSPKSKREFLQSKGFTIEEAALPAPDAGPEMDERVLDVEKAIRAFRKATQVNENVLAVRFGRRWNVFERDILPELIRRGILIETGYQGHGQQRRFKLGVGFDDVDHARRNSGGNYRGFLDELLRGN